MRHKYMKSLLLAAVALLGVALPSIAQDDETIIIPVKFITTDNADLSGQDIKLGSLYDDLRPVTIKADGTVDMVVNINYLHHELYYSVNGLSGAVYPQYDNEMYYQINLFKLRFNYEGSAPTTITISNNASESNFILPLNKDNYLPSSYISYFWGSRKYVELYEDTSIDLPILKKLTISSTMPESMKSSCYYSISKYEGTGSYYSDMLTTENAEDCIQPLEEGTYRVELRKRDGSYYSTTLESKIIELTSDQTVSFILRQLNISSTMPESVKSSCYYSISKKYEESGSYYSNVLSTENAEDCIQILGEGTYRVELRKRDGSYYSTTLGSKIIEMTSDQTVSFSLYTVKVKVVEPDGTPVEGEYVSYYISDGNNIQNNTDANGEISFVVANDTEITIYNSNYWDTQKYTITDNKTITLTVPKVISIKAKLNGQAVSYYDPTSESYGHRNEIYLATDSRNRGYSLIMNEDGTFSGRAEANKEYRVSFNFYRENEGGNTTNSIFVTDGMTLQIGKFSTKADGVGLDFFMRDGSSLIYGSEYGYYYVLVGGTPVRIAAVPVGNEQFTCWDINGHQYNNPMIDFTPKEDVTVATAKFTGTIVNQVKGVAGQNAETINVTIEGSYLVLPADVEAEAAIYATDGKLTKKTGIVGNRLYIGNLPDGAYVLVLTVDGRRQTATFVKE